jgi:hypothetical protein
LLGTGKDIRNIKKVKEVPNVPSAFGDHISNAREIRLSASTWGETQGVIDSYPYVHVFIHLVGEA